MKHYPSELVSLTWLAKDTIRWTVWLGWHSAEKVSAEPKGELNRVRNPVWSARAKARLTGFGTRTNSGQKCWPSDPLCFINRSQGRPKSYSGDNRVVAPESSNRRRGLLHRCRLFLSWPCRSGQGCGCSPIKRDRELGSIRCEAVWLLTGGGVRYLSGREF